MLDQFNNPTGSGSEAVYNQASQQQFRINENLVLANRVMINPLMKNYELGGGLYNYEICFNCLCSVLSEINSKLNSKEEELMKKFKNIIRDFIELRSPFSFIHDEGVRNKVRTHFNNDNWKELNHLLFEFRIEIERLMDVHGFGNPDKSDPKKALSEIR